MNSVGTVKMSFHRRGHNYNRTKMLRNLDLNSYPDEYHEGSSDSVDALFSHTSVDRPAPIVVSGLHSSPIDVDAIDDDDIQLLSSSTVPPEMIHQSSRARGDQITVILDDEDFNEAHAGASEEEHVATLLSLSMDYRIAHRSNVSLFGSELFASNDYSSKLSDAKPPPTVPPSEPKFSCPICLNELENASSTICGHIFCEKCIIQAIKKHKKCPNCRQKLTMTKFHRVYLPTAD